MAKRRRNIFWKDGKRPRFLPLADFPTEDTLDMDEETGFIVVRTRQIRPYKADRDLIEVALNLMLGEVEETGNGAILILGTDGEDVLPRPIIRMADGIRMAGTLGETTISVDIIWPGPRILEQKFNMRHPLLKKMVPPNNTIQQLHVESSKPAVLSEYLDLLKTEEDKTIKLSNDYWRGLLNATEEEPDEGV